MNAKAGKMSRRCWKQRVRKVYASPAELESYDSTYNIAERCGYDSAAALWEANPVLQGSTDPRDFGLARQPKARTA